MLAGMFVSVYQAMSHVDRPLFIELSLHCRSPFESMCVRPLCCLHTVNFASKIRVAPFRGLGLFSLSKDQRTTPKGALIAPRR
jgi:hypothetical protein